MDVLRARPAVALAGLGVAAAVAAAALYGDAAPYVGFLALARAVLPAVALAAAAVTVAVVGRGAGASFALTVASFAAAGPVLAIGLQQRSSLWVGLEALGQLLAPVVAVMALLYPAGRLEGRPRRGVVGLAVVVGLGATAGQWLTFDPAAWEWCRCVGNPGALLDVGPGRYLRVQPVLGLLAFVPLVAALAVVAWPVPRRGARLAFVATYAGLVVGWSVPVVREAGLVLLAALYVAGFVAGRPSRARVADLLLAAREEHDPRRLEILVGRVLGDDAAQVAWWDPARADFRDPEDRVVVVPDRGLLRVEAEGRPVALVTAERLDAVESGVRDSLAQALLLAAENRRLAAELRASLDQVRDSRARIVTAGDETRRRIERDLHDGAQQLLVSTGIKLNLAATRADGTELAGALDEASAELQRALAELRSLAAGIAPTALVHGGLDSALHELALRSAVPATVHVAGAGEPDAEGAATVYFVVSECLANVAKHAGASRVAVEVELGDPVRVTVSDDGLGGATLAGDGTGLRGLVDRVEARGGRLELASGSSGTTVTATVPTRGAPR